MMPFPRPAVPFGGCSVCGGAMRIHPIFPDVRRCNSCRHSFQFRHEATVFDDVEDQRHIYGVGPRVLEDEKGKGSR